VWERHLAAIVEAGAHSAEVALATKAGSLSHIIKTDKDSGVRELLNTQIPE
jgi:hypothetical protein